MFGDRGMKQINKMVFGGIELPPDMEEFMELVGRHFRPLIEPVPVFGDEELLRLQMPIQLYAGSKDMLLRSKASVQRLVKILPHAETHLLQDCGHAILGKTDEILCFLVKSSAATAD